MKLAAAAATLKVTMKIRIYYSIVRTQEDCKNSRKMYV